MKDVAGLMHLAFKLAHGISDACLDIEREPGLRGHRLHATLIADSGVSALAHVATASAEYSSPSLRSRLEVTAALRGARAELKTLKQRLHTVETQHYVPAEKVAALTSRIDELSVILMALAVEVRGNHIAA